MFTSPRQNEKSKQHSFITQLTSNIEQSQGAPSMISMLSPRNLMKYVSTAIDDYSFKPKVYKPDPHDEQQFLSSFHEYWSKTQPQYKRYIKLQTQKTTHSQKQQRNQQLQFKLKLQRIPQSYFDQKYQLFFTQKFNKLALKRKQQETAEYLDQIELLLWNKTSKNPEKFFDCIDNFDETIETVEKSLVKVKRNRKETLEKLLMVNKSQLKIKSVYMKKHRIEQTLHHLQCIQKIKLIKQQSAQSFSPNPSQQPQTSFQNPSTNQSQIHSKLQILQNIKKKQLQIAGKILSLSKIVNNLQFYRQQIKSSIYDKFSQQIIELMGKLLAYDKKAWENMKISPWMLGKEQEKLVNVLEESRLNITILDQSCFGNQINYNPLPNSHNQDPIHYQTLHPNSQTIKTLLTKLTHLQQAIIKFDLYDQQQINELIMRQLVRHNVMWNKDLDEFLNKLFDRFENAQKIVSENMKPILQEELEHDDEDSRDSRSKGIESMDEISQEYEERSQENTPKKSNNNYFTTITQMAGINQIKNLKDLSKLKNKTINTFKRFGNMKKISQALTGASQSSSTPQNPQPKDSYCKLKQNQVLEKQHLTKKQKQSKLSQVDTKFFLKAVKFYYQILSNLIKFIKQNQQLVFFQNFLEKLYSFIQERVRFFFSLRHINEKTSVQDFLLYLNLIQYWVDACDDVYQNLSSIKSTVTDQFLTALQKNALVSQLKQSIEESTYLPISISSTHINSFYYVFFWSSIQELKQQELNNMSLTILKDDLRSGGDEQNMALMDLKSFQKDFKIIDKRIVYKKDEFFVCDSFVSLVKELQKYLQLREVLTEFNSNIQQKICQVVGFYVWYNMKNINKTGGNTRPKTLKNLCNIYSTISFLKVIFTEQLKLSNKKFPKTIEQFQQFFKSLDNSIMMTPYYLVEQQISFIYQNNAMTQFQIPCKETTKILEIIKLSLQELKLHFVKEKIVKMFQPTVKVIMKNYFGYLASLGKRGLLEIKEFLPKYKELLLNYGFKRSLEVGDFSMKEPVVETHIFLKEVTEMEKNFKSKVSQMK